MTAEGGRHETSCNGTARFTAECSVTPAVDLVARELAGPKIVARGCDMVMRMGHDSHEQKGSDPVTASSAPQAGITRPEGAGASAAKPGRDDRDDTEPDYQRELGVVEAITFVTRSCPSGVVVTAAEQALDAIKEGGADVMKQQAYFVLTAIKGWRGDRARQVHDSLTRYLEGNGAT